MINLTPEFVIELLDKAVADRGEDHVYRSQRWDELSESEQARVRSGWSLGTGVVPDQKMCLYVEASTGEMRPSCIVGDVLVRAGLPVEVLADFESRGASTLLSDLTGAGHIEAPSDVVVTALTQAQNWQDAGQPWGVARFNAVAALTASAAVPVSNTGAPEPLAGP